MSALTRRSFVTAAMGASVLSLGARQAGASGLLGSLLGRAEAGDGEEAATPALEPGMIDPLDPSLSDDQTAAVLLKALIGFDFRTVLARCAVEDYLRSGSWILASLRQLSQDALADWPVDWDTFPMHVEGTLLALMSAKLRGCYAGDFLRPIARFVVDLAGIDVFSMEMDSEKRAENISRQLLELDAALASFDASSAVEVMGVQKCTSIVDCLEMGWLDPAYEAFEGGREFAAALGGSDGDLAASVYRCTLGYEGEPAVVVTLPLVRYARGWKLQRPCWFESIAFNFLAYAYDVADGFGQGAYSVSNIELPEVDYAPVPEPADEPFETIDDATDALLASLGYDVAGSSLAGQRSVVLWNNEAGFERLFCAERYLAELDLSQAYNLKQGPVTGLFSFLGMGSIGSFFTSSVGFLPVNDPRFRPLAAAAYVSAFGTTQLLTNASRAAIRTVRDSGAYDPQIAQLLEAFSPFPVQVNPLMLWGTIPLLLGGGATEEQVDAFMADFKFPFKMVADFLNELAGFWDGLGDPVAAFIDKEGTTVEGASAVANFLGGQPEAVDVILYRNDPVSGHTYHALPAYMVPCGGGWRIGDVEYLSSFGGMLPMDSLVNPIDALQGVDQESALAELSAASAEGMVEGARDLR